VIVLDVIIYTSGEGIVTVSQRMTTRLRTCCSARDLTRKELTGRLTRPAEYEARQKQAQAAPPPLTIKSHWPKPAAEGPECKLLQQ
jgi:hypothetical protein